jgi:hypothetical protein
LFIFPNHILTVRRFRDFLQEHFYCSCVINHSLSNSILKLSNKRYWPIEKDNMLDYSVKDRRERLMRSFKRFVNREKKLYVYSIICRFCLFFLRFLLIHSKKQNRLDLFNILHDHFSLIGNNRSSFYWQ